MKIKNNDSFTLDKFIEESLYNKISGYYMKKNPFGKKGDFITSPDISVLFSKKHNTNSFIFLDLVALSAPIGIFFGRIANFINSELYGRATDLPWSVQFVLIDNIKRHPSQLYEAFFEGIILFFVLGYFFKKDYLKVPGKISALFLIFYSLFRFFIEFFRSPDPQIGYLVLNLTLGQLISILFFMTGAYLLFLKK